MSSLPADATEGSRKRFELARRLVERCPKELGREIAVTGSVSRGLADEDSDIELNFWVERSPPAEAREGWLREVGATDIVLDENPGPDGTIWTKCRYLSIRVEPGWQTIASQQTLLRDILAGDVLDHVLLIGADMVAQAVPLRTNGMLARWQEQLADYPDVLQRRLIESTANAWGPPPPFRWALARRGERFVLAQRLVWDLQVMLRILFALNRQWQPEWKWLRSTTRALNAKPPRLLERIDDVLSMSDLEHSLETCIELFLDILRLVPPQVEVSRALASLESSLRERSP